MPSVDLARIKQEVGALSKYFQDAAQYVREIERTLEAYSVPVHRQGKIKGMRPILKTYQVPQLLMKHLQLEMGRQASIAPQQALGVADGLWELRSIETRQLAIHLLGCIPGEAKAVCHRLEAWTLENREPMLTPNIAHEGALSLSARNPNELVAFASRLLLDTEPRKQGLGIGVLQTLLTTTEFSNLPALFEMLSAPVQAAERRVRPDLAALLSTLAERSPHESEYFLQQQLRREPGEGTQWLVRQAIKALPEESQARLRSALS